VDSQPIAEGRYVAARKHGQNQLRRNAALSQSGASEQRSESAATAGPVGGPNSSGAGVVLSYVAQLDEVVALRGGRKVVLDTALGAGFADAHVLRLEIIPVGRPAAVMTSPALHGVVRLSAHVYFRVTAVAALGALPVEIDIPHLANNDELGRHTAVVGTSHAAAYVPRRDGGSCVVRELHVCVGDEIIT